MGDTQKSEERHTNEALCIHRIVTAVYIHCWLPYIKLYTNLLDSYAKRVLIKHQ